jgi:hypothetical protein
MIISIALRFVHCEAQEYVHGRLELCSLKSLLGVTRDTWRVYGDVDYNSALLITRLTGVAKNIADAELSAPIILEHANSHQRLVSLSKETEVFNR